jgi:hypothetical protein
MEPNAHHAFGDEVAHGADDAAETAPREPHRQVDDRSAVPLQRRDVQHRLVRGMVHLAQRRRRVDPLRVLLVAVEDVRRPHEALVDQRLHVAHRGRVAERESQLGLEIARTGQFVRLERLAVVERDRFLAQDVLAAFQRGPRQVEMRGTRRTDIHEVDVVARHHLRMVGQYLGNAEFARCFFREVALWITNGDHFAARIAFVAGEVGAARPCPGA